jgi:hypothetical protein
MERLPSELQTLYHEKHRKHFYLEDAVISTGGGRETSGSDEEGGVASSVDGAAARAAGRSPAAAAGTEPREGRAAEAHAMECLNEIMAALRDAKTLEGFLRLMLRRLLDLARARAAWVLTRQGERLHVRDSLEADASSAVNPSEAIVLRLVQRVLQTGRALPIADLIRDPHLGELGGLIKAGFRSLLVLPYKSAQEDGVIYLLDPIPRSEKLTDDVVFYNFFANLMPLALMQLKSEPDAALESELEREVETEAV